MFNKKIQAILQLVCMIVYVVCSTFMSINVEHTTYHSVNNERQDARGQKIKDELKNKTKLLSDDKECMLNEQGIFDIEIEGLTQEDLKIINDSKNVTVITEYYYIDSNNNEINCSDEEVESIIDAIYYDGRFAEKEDESVLRKIGEKMGILPMTAYAATTVTKTKNTAISSDEIMKKSLVISEFTSNGEVYATVNYMCTWLTTPSSREIDVMALRCVGGKTTASDMHSAYYLVDETITVKEEWPFSHIDSKTTKTLRYDRTEALWQNIDINEAAVWYDLRNDVQDKVVMYSKPWEGLYYHRITTKEYTNHRVYMRLWLKQETDAECIDFVGQYERSVKKYSYDWIDVAFNVAGSGDVINAIHAVVDGVKTEIVTEKVGRNILYEYKYK